jgi:hypothetical protein
MFPRFWIAVVSKEHSQWGETGNYIQVCHGKETPLKRMKKEDWILVYSPKTTMNGTQKCQSFTAIGRVADDLVYPFKMNENFIPFRRNVLFLDCVETTILPLINKLEFIMDKKFWGYPFRFGFFEISEKDFMLIKTKML